MTNEKIPMNVIIMELAEELGRLYVAASAVGGI